MKPVLGFAFIALALLGFMAGLGWFAVPLVFIGALLVT